MQYALPPLRYSYGALEPTIDELTMRIHHAKHHAGYVTNLNAALEQTEWASHPLEQLLGELERLPDDLRGAVRNNGGGHANHTLFWEIMAPDGGGDPAGPLADAIAAEFQSVRDLKRRVSVAGGAPVGRGRAGPIHRGAGPARTPPPKPGSPPI